MVSGGVTCSWGVMEAGDASLPLPDIADGTGVAEGEDGKLPPGGNAGAGEDEGVIPGIWAFIIYVGIFIASIG